MTEKIYPQSTDVFRKSCIIIPTYNASSYWDRIHAALTEQGVHQDQVFIVDSSSSDNTQDLVRRAGYRLKSIPKETFRHGATRQMAAKSMPWAEVLVFFTQDALSCGESTIENLLSAFKDPKVGAAYGRQIPRGSADPIERHSRLFNYPEISQVRTLASKNEMGIKAAFFSNSFAAYRRTALDLVGGFPANTIVSEEVTVVARMLMSGWKITYQADATVIHSHPLTVSQEFSRYFDIGVHHGREKWLLDEFGTAGGEGLRFVVSELRFLKANAPSFIPLALLRTITKWCGYKLGLHEQYLPLALTEALSGQPDFWRDEQTPVLSASNSPVAHSAHVSER